MIVHFVPGTGRLLCVVRRKNDLHDEYPEAPKYHWHGIHNPTGLRLPFLEQEERGKAIAEAVDLWELLPLKTWKSTDRNLIDWQLDEAIHKASIAAMRKVRDA